jgi:hypothetical protein
VSLLRLLHALPHSLLRGALRDLRGKRAIRERPGRLDLLEQPDLQDLLEPPDLLDLQVLRDRQERTFRSL